MTIEQEIKLERLYEEHNEITQQVKAITGKYDALYDVLKYATNKLAINEENIARVRQGKPMIEDDVQEQGELVQWLY